MSEPETKTEAIDCAAPFTPPRSYKTELLAIVIIWASLAFGVGYNTWRAHEAMYEANRVGDKMEVLDGKWEASEKRNNRRVDYLRRYVDKRFTELEKSIEK